MTNKLHFPSMDDLGDEADSSDFYYQNDFDGDDDGDERDDLLNGGTDDDDTGDDDSDKSKDGIRAGELEAFNKAKTIIDSDNESFQYFPRDDATEEVNQRFSISHLKKEWPGETQKNIGIANFFYKNFLNEASRKEAENVGIASHYLLILAFHRAALQAEKFGKEMMSGDTGDGLKKLRYKNMAGVTKQKLEERCRELASSVYNDAKNQIIKMHGSITNA